MTWDFLDFHKARANSNPDYCHWSSGDLKCHQFESVEEHRLTFNNHAFIVLNHLELHWLNLCFICTALYVCLYHVTQFFPQQGRLGGSCQNPECHQQHPRFFVFMKKLQLRGGVEGRTLENVLHLG